MSDRVTSIELKEDGNVLIRIDRPNALNALNRQVFEELKSFFEQDYKNIDRLNCIILTGSGEKAFVAGADIKELQALTSENARDHIQLGHRVMDAIESFHVPVIAAVNGFALGGGLELAMACHLRYASPNARFGLPELKLGLIPGYGGTQRLVRYVGRTKAMEMMLTGAFIDSFQAERYGLINGVSEVNLLDHCFDIAKKIGEQGPLSIEHAIQVMNHFGHEAMDFEQKAFEKLILKNEAAEGLLAFIEKRKAKFR